MTLWGTEILYNINKYFIDTNKTMTHLYDSILIWNLQIKHGLDNPGSDESRFW